MNIAEFHQNIEQVWQKIEEEPLLELWIASKLGGFHFAFKNGDWVSNDGKRFWDCLVEACAAHGENVQF